ncbi:MAG: hypothetical protein V3U27_15320 [Candidatus Tectomicrobia bacterium]
MDLFTQRALRCVQTRRGAWVMSLGAQHGTLQPDGTDTWQVVQVRHEIQPVLLGHGLPLLYTQGFAEDFARLQGMERLVDVDAPWRQDPDTEKQTALLGKLGVAVRPKLTKGEAADLITTVLGDWNEDTDHGRHRLLSLSHAVHPKRSFLMCL